MSFLKLLFSGFVFGWVVIATYCVFATLLEWKIRKEIEKYEKEKFDRIPWHGQDRGRELFEQSVGSELGWKGEKR